MKHTLRESHSITPRSFYLLIFVVLFHLLLNTHSQIALLFPNKEIGNLAITLIVIAIFAGMFHFENKSLTKSNFLMSMHFQKNTGSYQKYLRLFLLTIIPITIIGIIARIIVIVLTPQNLAVADMLPLIEKSGETLLQGYNPYQVYFFPYAMPLTFLPGLWLIYIPSIALGFDLRLTGIFIWIIISIILVYYTVKVSSRNSSSVTLLLSGANICLLQVSPELIGFHIYGHTFALWLWLVILCIGLLEEKPILTSIALGLAISSRQTSIIFIPVIFAFCLYHHSWRAAFKCLLVSVSVFLIFAIPFLIMDPYQFLVAPILHYQNLANYDLSLNESRFIIDTIGFAYFIQTHWGTKLLSLFSAMAGLIIAISSFLMARNQTRLMLFLAAIVTFFLFFTPIPWTYTYYPVLLILSFVFLT